MENTREASLVSVLSPWQRKKKKKWKREKQVHGQIHLPLLQSIFGQKKYTITRQEEAKINGPPTSPLTSIHLHPIPLLFLSLSFLLMLSSLCLHHPSFCPHTRKAFVFHKQAQIHQLSLTMIYRFC